MFKIIVLLYLLKKTIKYVLIISDPNCIYKRNSERYIFLIPYLLPPQTM